MPGEPAGEAVERARDATGVRQLYVGSACWQPRKSWKRLRTGKPTPGLEPGTPSYERTTSEGRASTRGHAWARFSWRSSTFTVTAGGRAPARARARVPVLYPRRQPEPTCRPGSRAATSAQQAPSPEPASCEARVRLRRPRAPRPRHRSRPTSRPTGRRRSRFGRRQAAPPRPALGTGSPMRRTAAPAEA